MINGLGSGPNWANWSASRAAFAAELARPKVGRLWTTNPNPAEVGDDIGERIEHPVQTVAEESRNKGDLIAILNAGWFREAAGGGFIWEAQNQLFAGRRAGRKLPANGGSIKVAKIPNAGVRSEERRVGKEGTAAGSRA